MPVLFLQQSFLQISQLTKKPQNLKTTLRLRMDLRNISTEIWLWINYCSRNDIMNWRHFSPEPGRHRQDRMCLIDQCQHCSVSRAAHELLYRELQNRAPPTENRGKRPEMLERQSPATLCSETESLHVFLSSTVSHILTCQTSYSV